METHLDALSQHIALSLYWLNVLSLYAAQAQY